VEDPGVYFEKVRYRAVRDDVALDNAVSTEIGWSEEIGVWLPAYSQIGRILVLQDNPYV